MAEAVFYGNSNEPDFPYEQVAAAVAWVPHYIHDLTTNRGRDQSQAHLYSVLINTILVFTRARTSAMFDNRHYSACRDFVRRLNTVLDLIHGAHYHQTELVQRNNKFFFITCSRSPRFIWKQNLTHREVGLNLDYAAAGHIGQSSGVRMGASFCEISESAYTQITSEMVHHEHIQDLTTIQNFLDRKVSLFNSTMIRLHLPYRFDYYWNTDRKRYQEVTTIMDSNIPPSAEWWRKNYLFLAKYPYDMAYASKDSLFELHWPVMRETFQLAEAMSLSIKRPIHREYSAEIENLLSKVYAATHSLESRDDSILLNEISEVRQRLHIENAQARREQSEEYIRRTSDLRRLFYALVEWSRIRTLERWKLRAPLINNELTSWPASGDEQWMGGIEKGRQKFGAKLADFFFDRYILM